MIKLLLIVFLSPALVSAKIYFNDGLFPEPATSARALGMGNTYLAKADGTMAVWYNPAGLGTVRYPSFHLNNVHLEGNNGWFDALGKRDGPTKMFKPSHIQKLLKDQRGQLYHTRFHALPNFTGRFFSIGFLYSNQVRGIMAKKEEGSLFELASRNDWGPYTGLAIPFFGGIIKFGASAIWLNREEYYGDSDGEEEFKKIASNNRKGSMVLVTGGFRLTFPWTALPTLALKVNNLTEDEFRFSGENNQPLTIKRTFDGAISITPRLGARTRLHIEVSYRDLTKEYPEESGLQRGITNGRRLGAGIELDFSRMFFVRAGYGDGFGSGGLGFRSKKLKYDLTTYGVDTTAKDFRGKEDRRFVLSISTGL